jgi:hypothetical protein
MEKMEKMNVLLAKTDNLGSSFKKLIAESGKFFRDKQGSFKGEKKTYIPKEGSIDIPGERKNELVTTTVDEKLDYVVETSAAYINALFSQERTNASSGFTVPLEVDGVFFGNFTSLELLRLKSLLESSDIESMYTSIPVRPDNETWNPTQNEMYIGRNVYESELTRGTKKTTVKESYILPDPNISALGREAKYTPQIASRDTTMDLGDYTFQKFSGEYTHRQKAEILRRRTKLVTATIEALKRANDIISVESDMTADKLFGYLHKGEI